MIGCSMIGCSMRGCNMRGCSKSLRDMGATRVVCPLGPCMPQLSHASCHAQASELPLELKPNAREKKNFGGRDTIGMATGVECGKRAISQLAMIGAKENDLEALKRFPLEVTEVEQQWWVTGVESKEQVRWWRRAGQDRVRSA